MSKISHTILENNFLRIILEENENFTSEMIELKEGNEKIPLISSFEGISILTFYNGEETNSRAISFRDKTNDMLRYSLNQEDMSIDLEIRLEDNNLIHFKYNINCHQILNYSKILANYAILLGNDPTYTWVPHIRNRENLVIPDHVFRSPAIIYSKGKNAFALIPDLEILKNNRPFQTFMDLNLKPGKYNGIPQLSYGFGNYMSTSHILFEHNPKKKMKIDAGTKLSFGYYIKVYNNKPISFILEDINTFLWEQYGKKLLYENFNPQILPYDKNVEEGFKVILERHKCWGNFKINDVDCGGFWRNTWMGEEKKPFKFVTEKNLEKHRKLNLTESPGSDSEFSKTMMKASSNPKWIKRFDELTRHKPIAVRNAEVWNNAWFLNIRSCYAFRYFGELWNDANLIDKGKRSLNTILNLPRIRGVHPSVVLPAGPETDEILTINGMRAFIFTDNFDMVDTSLAMFWALKYYQDFCDEKEEIEKKAEELLNLFKEIQLENGAIPVYINFKSDKNTPIIYDDLINSASSGAPLMFLTEYYKVSKDRKIIPIAEKIAKYIQVEIIPQDKWWDFEAFYSCSHLPLDFYDDYTKSHVMNTLCMYWCADGLKELYKITNNKEYLKLGERVMSILSLFQQIWNMPYLSYNTFGGFGVQNADAELSDARQGLFVRTYMEYYLTTGKKEYMERGIATIRACWAMQLLKEYEEQCPGNLEGIETVDGIDKGAVVENYGHSGWDLRVPGYIMFDWGVGSSATATAYAKKHFGDLFVDFKEKIVWGIDGVLVKSFVFQNGKVEIKIDVIQGKQNMLIKGRETPEKGCEIILNGKSLGKNGMEELNEGFQSHF